ncbi:uncharacterized protein LOC123314186 [Coccinella septempunctata]|uniref:uncharacterized protein LOC123314186 n=1 Tax=Coccinella septempunctata TaxID=41139 RepID=UPI001D073970|nr:uncharacterized protein LOC123314186 [Coccinella septempunctata]
MSSKVLVLLVLVFGYCACEDVYSSCQDSYHCVEKRLIKLVDGLDSQSNVSVLGDLVTLNKNEEQFEAARAGEDLLERCARYLANREIRFKLPSEISKNLIEESRSSKLKKILLPLLILLKLKGAIVITIVLAVIALISFKGLGASLIALAISGATGFKSLLENHAAGSKVYEVLPSVSASHWSRVGVDPISPLYPSGAFA